MSSAAAFVPAVPFSLASGRRYGPKPRKVHLRSSICSPIPSSFLRNRPTSIRPSASVSSVEHVVEAATSVKFPKELMFPGCSNPLILLGTGFREKVFAIIGVKVYAAAFYAEGSMGETLTFDALKGKPVTDVLQSSAFTFIFEAPFNKALNIMLVRNVDGKTFWDALNDVISPRMSMPTLEDESALAVF